jgi:hypothetical protein
VADDPASLELGVTPLGHFVAIDGENGVVRPFLFRISRLLRLNTPHSGAPRRGPSLSGDTSHASLTVSL